jgi:hypothetical protein
MKLKWLVAVVASGLMCVAASASPGPWEQPAAALAEEIAAILGPGQAHLTIRNLSTIPIAEIPAIRRLLEQDLKTRGVLASGADSANSIRVTLSENVRERLWVAEIVEGNQTRVAMVHVDADTAHEPVAEDRIALRREHYLGNAELSRPFVLSNDQPVLAVIGVSSGLVVLRQSDVVIFAMTAIGWKEQKVLEISVRSSLPRDPRGILLPTSDGNGFTALFPGTECVGNYAPRTDNGGEYGDWTMKCHDSDDPWPISTADTPTGPTTIKAFYNPARNYFTGVVTPSIGVDLPPFYSAALIPRPASGAALVINGIDGKVQLADLSSTVGLKPVSGTRDWGSDFAVLHTNCGAGAEIIASGSGEAASDSLRAYELPAQEAIPASAPLAMEGTVTALFAAPDGKSVFAVVRKAANQGASNSYEVDRVTASCN